MSSKKEEKKHRKSEQENHQQKAKETNQLQTSTSRKTLRRLRNEQQIEKMSSKVPHGISVTLNLDKAIEITKEKVKGISKLFKDAKFYADDVSPGDVQQGMEESLRLFVLNVMKKSGLSWRDNVFKIQLHYFTFINNNNNNSSCKDPNETWLPLLEKAYAKIHGDYESIEGGTISHALEDLTGSVSTGYATSEILDTDRL
ncbi:10391_t:CDS:2 [Ambispora leptoticha]|uniref:10391_t:CDS:1 n=1 Tax=Ambispora leptoticha TaxID=144679 RepID=A0A9N9EVA6_9GLOM|nr:10391_t:CDS:2 [Ambispora leptoticha]